MDAADGAIVVSGGAGAVGTVVGVAILESGADVVFVDILPEPNAETWGKLSHQPNSSSKSASRPAAP